MEILAFLTVLCIVGLVMLTYFFIEDDNHGMSIITSILCMFSIMLLFYIFYLIGEREGQIDAMENKWHYEQHIVYKDTIPVDTLYVKIK